MRDKKEYREVGTELYNKLRLLTSPVAIKFVKPPSEFPEKLYRPSKMGIGDLLFYLNDNIFKSGGCLNFGQPSKFLLREPTRRRWSARVEFFKKRNQEKA